MFALSVQSRSIIKALFTRRYWHIGVQAKIEKLLRRGYLTELTIENVPSLCAVFSDSVTVNVFTT